MNNAVHIYSPHFFLALAITQGNGTPTLMVRGDALNLYSMEWWAKGSGA